MPPRKSTTKIPAAVTFGSRVRELRHGRKWTQERLAEAADINVVQLSHIENGLNEPKLTTILRLARALDVKAGKLIGD